MFGNADEFQTLIVSGNKNAEDGVIWRISNFQTESGRAALQRSSQEKVFWKYAAKFLCNFTEVAVQHGSSPINLPDIFKTSFYKNTYGGLLLTYKYCKLSQRETDNKLNVFLPFATRLAVN